MQQLSNSSIVKTYKQSDEDTDGSELSYEWTDVTTGIHVLINKLSDAKQLISGKTHLSDHEVSKMWLK